MARILRLKADLQKVVVSAEYGAQTFSAPTTAASTGDDENPDVQRAAAVLGTNDPVKAILLDEDNFWVPLIDTLRVMTPVVKLLRLTDGVAPVMGKILPQMEAIRETIANLNMPWKSKVLSIHNERWVYLQSPMHYAGTCLDPEFLMRDMDQAAQDGLITVTERLCLREEKLSRFKKGAATEAEALTITSDEVQERVAATMLQLSSYQEKEGIFSKPFVQNNAKIQAPSAWWSTFGMCLPLVSTLARTVLSQPVCASAAGACAAYLRTFVVSYSMTNPHFAIECASLPMMCSCAAQNATGQYMARSRQTTALVWVIRKLISWCIATNRYT